MITDDLIQVQQHHPHRFILPLPHLDFFHQNFSEHFGTAQQTFAAGFLECCQCAPQQRAAIVIGVSQFAQLQPNHGIGLGHLHDLLERLADARIERTRQCNLCVTTRGHPHFAGLRIRFHPGRRRLLKALGIGQRELFKSRATVQQNQ